MNPRANGAELVGPPEAQEDVTDVPDRTLVLRATDEVLRMRYEMGGVIRELASAAEDRRRTRALVASFEKRLDATQDELRRVPSRHDMAEEAREAAEITASHMIRDDKLATLSDEQKARRALRYGIIGSVVAGIILAIVMFIAGKLTR